MVSDSSTLPINAIQKRALVVDDDSTMVEYVSAVLRRAGFQVETAGDGLTALEMCRESHFDAVVCDIRMPKLSGNSFLKNLRLTPASNCRVVLLSAMDDLTIRREALAAGAVAYLVKPASSKAIIAAVSG
ncbi:MAG: response regulator [Betaproteobacteria bacterium]